MSATDIAAWGILAVLALVALLRCMRARMLSSHRQALRDEEETLLIRKA